VSSSSGETLHLGRAAEPKETPEYSRDWLGQNFDPVGQDKEEAALEDGTRDWVSPLVVFDEHENIVNVEALL